MKPNSFTLIELVIVIAVLSILSAVVVITINPAEQMRSARDSRRAEELTTINKAISLYVADGGSSLGSTNIVYVSIPDSSATCANLGLPTLPTGWSYRCSTSTNLQKTNGTGWIPINFSNISFTTPLSSLPVDPVNTTSTGNYYTYITGGSWELTSSMESAKYKLGGANDKTSKDGGLYTGLYELGTNLTLLPLDYGDTSLVGYWKFDEASGTLYDSSGKGNNGTQSGGVTYGATGKVGNALSFDGVDDYVETNDSNSLDINLSDFSIAFWIKTMTTSNTNSYRIINKRASNYIGYEIYIEAGSNLTAYFISDSGGYSFGDIGSTNIRDANWHCVVLVFNRIHNAMVYIDGNIKSPQRDISTRQGSLNNSQPLRIGSSGSSVANLFNGLIDDVRIYNRALSATEIQALYNATNK